MPMLLNDSLKMKLIRRK